jgi:putative DNA primase/helicase
MDDINASSVEDKADTSNTNSSPGAVRASQARKALWESGYRPVALYRRGKRPWGNDWVERARRNPPEAVAGESFDELDNTGILCDGLRAIDIDVDDPARAAELDRLVVQMFGKAPMRYRENSPRHLHLFSAAEGQPHHRGVSNRENGEKVEVLGAGQQLLAHGLHDSGAALHWTHFVAAADLTPLTEDQVGEFLEAAAKIIGATDIRGSGGGAGIRPPEELEAVNCELLERIYNALPNTGAFDQRTAWIALAHATKAAFIRDPWRGRHAFVAHAERWSDAEGNLRVPKEGQNLADEAYRVWDTMGDGHEVGAGYILSLARKLGVDGTLIGDYETAILMQDFGPFEAPPAGYKHPLPRPTIHMRAGELAGVVDKAEAALIESGLPLYQRGRGLVRPGYQEADASDGRKVVSPCLVRMDQPGILDCMSQAAYWVAWSSVKNDWEVKDPKEIYARVLLSRYGQWRFPVVAGVIATPTLRPDGSILSEPGYDRATQLYFIRDPGLAMPDIPESPTKEDALAALALLEGLLVEFPLVSDVDRAVALSGLITPVVRAAMPVAPLHAFRAPTAGSGKSYLVDLACVIPTGQVCPVSPANESREEAEKHLTGLLLAGFPVISLDNIDPKEQLGSGLLCQAVERPTIRLRGLGKSDIYHIQATVTAFSTGNNLTVVGDMNRRTIIANLDPGIERPELREFRSKPVDIVAADRGRYVAACLTISRAYLVAGKPGRLPPLASYEAWSDIVRSALVWLGCADPAGSIETTREEDPQLAWLGAVLAGWEQHLGTQESFTTKQVLESARASDDKGRPKHQGWRETLLPVCGGKGTLDDAEFGLWLRGNKGRVINKLRIVRDKTSGGIAWWKLQRVD